MHILVHNFQKIQCFEGILSEWSKWLWLKSKHFKTCYWTYIYIRHLEWFIGNYWAINSYCFKPNWCNLVSCFQPNWFQRTESLSILGNELKLTFVLFNQFPFKTNSGFKLELPFEKCFFIKYFISLWWLSVYQPKLG